MISVREVVLEKIAFPDKYGKSIANAQAELIQRAMDWLETVKGRQLGELVFPAETFKLNGRPGSCIKTSLLLSYTCPPGQAVEVMIWDKLFDSDEQRVEASAYLNRTVQDWIKRHPKYKIIKQQGFVEACIDKDRLRSRITKLLFYREPH